MEQYGNICLLRSLTVKVEERKNGLADKLIKEVTDFAVNAKCVGSIPYNFDCCR